MCEGNRGWIFSLEKVLIWIMGSYFGQTQQYKVKYLNLDVFLLQTHRFSLHKLVIDGLDYLYIIVIFLSAVWTLILTAPIHCRR